jgi:cobyrinic acid a,c-diamide synthase
VKKAIAISAVASNQGKTLLMSALLSHFKGRVRAFKIGPDFIDPQFHQKISANASINLDTFMMSKEQVKWIFNHYADKELALLEGVMGYYDGMDRGCSAYDVTALLAIPTIMIIDASATYITLSAILKGLTTYQQENTICAIILNKISSKKHFTLIQNIIEKDHPKIKILGWIPNHLEELDAIHLGLTLCDENFKKLPNLAAKVLEHIDIEALYQLASSHVDVEDYPFEKIPKSDKTVAIVEDKNFSFLYHDNVAFLKEVFREVIMIDSSKDETFEADNLYIPGGYVETETAYKDLKRAKKFKATLQEHAKTKPIYAECAGFLYLSQAVDEKEMAGVLDISFKMQKRPTRVGYFELEGIKGHCFHYSKPQNKDILIMRKNRVCGTYLHTFFRNNIPLLRRYFDL